LPLIVRVVATVGLIVVVTGCGNAAASRAADLAGTTSRGAQAYVCNFGYDDQPGTTITALDLTSRRVEASVTTGSLPSAAAATPDGHLLLVTDQGDDNLAVLDGATDRLLAHIPTGEEPDAVAVSPDGKTALVANVDDDTVTPVNLTTLRAGHPIEVGSRPDAVAIGGPDGTTALVADLEGNTVTPINLGTMTAGAPIPVGDEPDAIIFNPDGTTALVADFGSGTVTPINLVTMHPDPSVSVGPGPTALAVPATATAAGDGAGAAIAWITTGEDLVPVNLSSFSVGPALAVGHLAEAVAIGGDHSTAWVAGQDGTVTPVDLATGVKGASIYVGGRPSAIIIPPPLH
jgi:hyaluronoglucosaminidase